MFEFCDICTKKREYEVIQWSDDENRNVLLAACCQGHLRHFEEKYDVERTDTRDLVYFVTHKSKDIVIRAYNENYSDDITVAYEYLKDMYDDTFDDEFDE